MLRRLVTSRKSLVIVPVVLALVLTGLFLPAREVSIEPYGMLSLESKITISVGYEVAYASPAEYLQNPSFTGGDTGWTLATTIYDASVYQDTAGSIETNPGVGRNNEVTGTATQTISTSINSTDTVTLSLYWEKSYVAVTPVKQIIEAQIEKPSTPGVWTTIWSDNQIGDFVWTSVGPIDVSSYFDETGTYGFRFYMNPRNGNNTAAETHLWIDNTHLDVVAPVPDISNLPTSKDFGDVYTSQSYWSNDSAPNWTDGLNDGECHFTVTNNSSAAVNIDIKATDFSDGKASGGWDLGGTAGTDVVVLKAGPSEETPTENDMVILAIKDTDYDFILGLSNVAPNNTKMWELKMETPTSFSNADVKTAIITLTATF